MVYERAVIEVKEGAEAAFEAAVKEAAPYFQKARGCSGLSLQRSVEHPTQYVLVVKWDTVEDHTVHFRGAPEFQEWRRLASPHFASPPQVEHFSEALVCF